MAAKTILVVDDSTSMRRVVADLLKNAGHQTITAENGLDALRKVAHGDDDIDLVISDVNMPEMDGISLVSELKQLPQFDDTPVIMLTTEAGKDMKVAAKQAGATAWIIKPFDSKQLLAAVTKLTA